MRYKCTASETDCSNYGAISDLFSAVCHFGGTISQFFYDRTVCSFIIHGCSGERIVCGRSCIASLSNKRHRFTFFVSAGRKRKRVLSRTIECSIFHNSVAERSFSVLKNELCKNGAVFLDECCGDDGFSLFFYSAPHHFYSLLRLCHETAEKFCLVPTLVFISPDTNEKGFDVQLAFRIFQNECHVASNPLCICMKYAYLFHAESSIGTEYNSEIVCCSVPKKRTETMYAQSRGKMPGSVLSASRIRRRENKMRSS